MHEETIATIIDALADAVGALGKEEFVHRKQMQSMEKRKEMEVELAEARHGAASEPAATEPEPTMAPVVTAETDLSAAFADLKSREQCGICRDLLEAIEQADPHSQVIALSEYGKLKRAVETGADEAEMRDILESSDELQALLEQQVTSAP